MIAEAVLFDLDGLLVDSEPVWYDVESGAVDRLGGVWSPAHQAACIGGTIDQTCRYILDLTGGSVTPAALQMYLLDEMVRRFHDDLPLRTGAVELLDALAARDVPVGLVSSSYRVLVDAALDVLGRRRFAVTIAGDEVTQGKPDPEPYRLACERLRLDPATVVVLEDSPNGVASAEAAGCSVVALPEVAPIASTPRRRVVNSLAGIEPDWLLALPA